MKEFYFICVVLLFTLSAVFGFSPHRAIRNRHSVFKRQSSSNFEATGFLAGNYTEQCLDHDDPICTKWTQRYWQSSQYYNQTNGGPLFMMLGGEIDVTLWNSSAAWLNYAQNHNAYMLIVEHRFYGQSFPTLQTNRSAEAMRVLTSQQALADYAQILTWFKAENLNASKVVVFGGSYSGGLAAWFREQYPKLVNVAVASSAPLNYTLEFPEYVGTTSRVIKEINEPCFNSIYNTFQCMQNIVNNTPCAQTTSATLTNLPAKINRCDLTFGTEIDVEQFFIKTGRELWVTNNPGTSSPYYCSTLLSQTNPDIIEAYGDFMTQINKNSSCPSTRKKRQSDSNESSSSSSEEMMDPSYTLSANATNDPGGYLYSWYWQSCNEFVNFQVADPVLQMLGTNFSTNAEVYGCTYYYPDANFNVTKIQMNVDNTRKQYKTGKDYKGTCVIFTNGSWDPWATKSITSPDDTSSENTVFHIKHGEHIDDMFSPPRSAIAQVTQNDIIATQAKIQNQIGLYLQSDKC